MTVSNATLQASADEIRDWLLETAVFMPDLAPAFAELCERIVAAGVPIARATTAVQLLHVTTRGMGREWRQGEALVERRFPYGSREDQVYETSPFALAHQTGEWVILRPPGMDASSFGVMPELKAGGYTHYVCIPLTFSTGRNRNGITFATRAADGFAPEHFAFFRRIVPAVRAVMELRANARILDEILETYVGGDPHQRILAGDIHRGTVTRIRSAILFADLRGYTELSMSLPEEDIADLLNRYFDCLVPAIGAEGGEVLKFIGDGLLAIFHDADGDSRGVCERALAAAQGALAAIERANSYGSLPAPLAAGIALHYGEAAYGNIGSRDRLDFTVIGRDVNIANRMSRLNKPLAAPILMSQSFADHIPERVRSAGAHAFRGVPGTRELFTPA